MLGQNIKKYRKKLGISQEGLARKSDVTFTSLTKIESGINKNPTIKTVKKLADTFGITIDELIGRKLGSRGA